MARRAKAGGRNKVKPRWEQTVVRDMAGGEPGLFWFQLGLGGSKPVAFLFEVEDDDGELVGVHWYSPGFDKPLDAAGSNKLERGTVTLDPPDLRIIVRVDTDDGRVVKLVRNDPAWIGKPDAPGSDVPRQQIQDFLDELGDETLEEARRRAFSKAQAHYGIK